MMQATFQTFISLSVRTEGCRVNHPIGYAFLLALTLITTFFMSLHLDMSGSDGKSMGFWYGCGESKLVGTRRQHYNPAGECRLCLSFSKKNVDT